MDHKEVNYYWLTDQQLQSLDKLNEARTLAAERRFILHEIRHQTLDYEIAEDGQEWLVKPDFKSAKK